MRVSIIICTRNRADHLRRTLGSLAEISVPPGWEAELILVDNGSTDDTRSVMEAFGHPDLRIRILEEREPGKSRALNHALKAARGQIILFTDDDVRIPQDWIQGMCRPILNGRGDAVAGGVELAPGLKSDWMKPEHETLLASTVCMSEEAPEHLVGANMAVSRSVFDKIPGFDVELGGGRLGNAEDTLFAWQVREAGYTIVSAFDVAVEHHPDRSRLSRGSFCRMAENRGRSEGYISYHWEHNEWPLWKLYAGWVYYSMQLLLLEIGRLPEGPAEVGIPLEEFEMRRKRARICQHIDAHGESPKYPERGMRKIDAPRPEEGAGVRDREPVG